jgi:hypothetical protein
VQFREVGFAAGSPMEWMDEVDPKDEKEWT